MKVKLMNFVIIVILISSLFGCSKKTNLESQLIGTWYKDGSQEVAFIFYDDGTCEITGEYGAGTWCIVNNNQLKLTNIYGETDTATISSIENNYLTLSNQNSMSKFINLPQQSSQKSQDKKVNLDDDSNAELEPSKTENFKNNTEKISTSSEVNIKNTINDGTLWVIETDELGQRYVVHTNIYGDVLGKTLYEFDGVFEYGLDANLYVINNIEYNKISIYDINSNEEIFDIYKGDYDEIISFIKTEQEPVFVARKIVESYEEKYACLILFDRNGKELFNISLDKKTLLDKYNIESDYSPENATINYAGNNVYYIEYLGPMYPMYGPDKLNSLIIDLNRNKVIPVDFPQRNGLYCKSDGDHTLIYIPYHGTIIVNNEAGSFENFSNSKYHPEGELSEGVFFAIANGNEKAYLDTQGNIAIDLNIYPQSVERAWPFENGTALIMFENNYLTYIDINGEFLFEPIKGHSASYFKEEGVAIASYESESDENKCFSIDKNGNTIEISLPAYNLFLVEYNGKKYWVRGGSTGLHMQEYVTTRGTT